MKQILRLNTFETNSSSIHSLILMSTEEFEQFKNEELFYNRDIGEFVDKEFVMNDKEFEGNLEDFLDESYTYYSCRRMETENLEVYNKDGNKEIALSFYISE